MSAPQQRPRATAADLVEIVRTHDLGVKAGKAALWALVSTLGREKSDALRALCDQHRASGLAVGDANRMAALDFAKTLDGAENIEDSVWEQLRDGADPKSATTSAVETIAPSSSPDDELQRLEREVRERHRKSETTGGLPEAVSFVAANLHRPLSEIRAEDVPNGEALNQLVYARRNETEWRRLYDSRRVPAKGFASDTERGFVDDGEAVHEVYLRIRAEMAKGLTCKCETCGHEHAPEKSEAEVPALRVAGGENGGGVVSRPEST